MRIILEGVDGLGKSTLAEKICNKFGLGYYHPPKPKKEQYENFHIHSYSEYQRALQLNHVVLDRSFISEYAYNYKHDFVYLQHFNKFKTDYFLFLIYFDKKKIDSLDFWKKKEIEDKTNDDKKQKFINVNERYLQAFNYVHADEKMKILFDGDYDKVANQIEKAIAKYLKNCKTIEQEWRSLINFIN